MVFKLDSHSPTTERYLLVLLNRVDWCVSPTLENYYQVLVKSGSSGDRNPAHERNGRSQQEEEAKANSSNPMEATSKRVESSKS